MLDVGCGSGLFLGLLAAMGKQIEGTGFDTSVQAIELAQRMAARLSETTAASLKFIRLDVNESWPPGEFDVVSVIDVMHHVSPQSQRQFFSLAARAVSPGGVLIYKDMCRRPTWRAIANRAHDLFVSRQWIHYLPVQSAEAWGVEEKLQLEHACRVDLFWYGHEFRIFRKPAGQ